MDDLARLQIRVDSLEVATADQRLGRLSTNGAQAERATDGLTASFKKLIGPLAAVISATAGASKLVEVARQFDVLNAQLITATGSAANAEAAFVAIQDFASTTPYDLAQATEGFVKLVNLGLTPSEAALTSYGNTAAAMGKDLSQLVEAVADATTGEFERLKEFGIKSKSEGDNVSFTFRGVTTTVKKNAEEIEGYLQALGENEFAGAMAERAKTLDGAISNLGDEWDKLFLNVSQKGVGSAIESSVRVAIDVLAELNAILSSGQLEGYIDALTLKFDGFGSDVAAMLDSILSAWDDFLGSDTGSGIVGGTVDAISFIVNAFQNLPENLRAVVQLMAVELAAFVDYGQAYGEAFGEVLGSEFGKIVEKSKAYGTAIGQALNPFEDSSFDLESRLRELDSIAAEMADNAFSRAEEQVNITRNARRESILSILDERTAALESFDSQIQAATDLRKAYDDANAARAASTEDRLAQFSLAPKNTETQDDTGPTGSGPKDAQAKALDDLAKSLRTEEEVIAESYSRRLAIILDNTEQGSVKQNELKARLDAEFAEQAVGSLSQVDTYDEQLEAIQDFYERRQALIMENIALTEEQRTALELELTTQRNEQLAALEIERTSAVLNNSSNLFGELAGLSAEFAGEQSTLYKGMFAVSKAFAIAESIVKIQQGIASAAALPFPANIPAIASTVAATSSVVSTITGTNFSGAYDSGGIIPQGKVGLVGEFGPELVAGPTNVTGRRETAEMLRDSQAKESAPQPAPQVNVKNVNVLDPAVVGDYLATDAGEQLIMNTVQRNQRALGF